MSLDLPTKPLPDDQPRIRRLNRLPIIAAIVLAILFFAVIIYGLSTRGLYFRNNDGIGDASNSPPASDFADRLKRGVGDGVIAAPAEPVLFRPEPVPQQPAANPFKPAPAAAPAAPAREIKEPELEPEHVWRARLRREHEEQYLREQQRQRMARYQAGDAAYDSPIAVQIDRGNAPETETTQERTTPGGQGRGLNAADLYAAAAKAGLGGQGDPNGQKSKGE
ncbi:MAG: conjugal transfer protein TrbI, partial [Rhizobiaceae bacterium]